MITALYSDNTVFSVLLDCGQSGDVLIENAKRLGIDLGKVNLLVFSHRHYDHTNGVVKLFRVVGPKTVVAHPHILKPCIVDRNGFKRFWIGLSKEAEEAISKNLLLVRREFELAPKIWFLGEIERVYDNSYATKGFYTVENGEIVKDEILDDTGIAIDLGKRVYVVAGCSHSGIQNIVSKAIKITKAEEAVVIGGLHLAFADEKTVERVVNELIRERVVEIYAGHCTGYIAEAIIWHRLRDKFKKIYTGYTITIEANG